VLLIIFAWKNISVDLRELHASVVKNKLNHGDTEDTEKHGGV
jgi:hypothetical protein